jgi:hypothetical protein
MKITIEVPEDVARHLELTWHDLPQRAVEALAIEAYRSGVITEAEVQRMLPLSSRWEVDAILKRAKAYLDYTEADLEQDIRAIRRVLSQ